MNDVVYTVSHWHYCSNIGGFPDTNPRDAWYHATAVTSEAQGTVAHNGQGGYYDYFGTPAPAMINWYPTLDTGTYTGQSQAAWSAAVEQRVPRARRRVPEGQRHRPAGPGAVRRALDRSEEAGPARLRAPPSTRPCWPSGPTRPGSSGPRTTTATTRC